MYKEKIVAVLAASTFVASGFASASAYAHSLPLGDGKVSSSPKKGNVYSCQRHFRQTGIGAHASGSWLDLQGRTWDPELKPIVDGSVKWPGKVSISLEGDTRIVTGNGLPTHATGQFPVSRKDDAYQYDRNPNSISGQKVLLRLPANPTLAANPTCVPMGMIGFATTGVAIFNALDAGGRDAPAHEIQDKCDGHPQQSGMYHYHNLSKCLKDTRSGPNGTSDLLGYSLDGFGIYGSYENGRKLTSKDLDECHGRTSNVMWNGKVQKVYHYVFTDDYPYTIGCFRGDVTVKTSLGREGGPGLKGGQQFGQRDGLSGGQRPSLFGGAQQRQGLGGRGREMLMAVADQLGVSFEELRRAAGGPPPNFRNISRKLKLSEAQVRAAFEAARSGR